jgi:hypothetical protein
LLDCDDREDADHVDCRIDALRRRDDKGIAITSGVGREQRSSEAVVPTLRDQLTTDLVDAGIGDDHTDRGVLGRRQRLDRLGLRFDRVLTEFVGAGATHGKLAGDQSDAPEVQLRFGVRGQDRAAVERFTREIAPLVLNGPPSVTGFAGGRPKVEEIVAYWPALIDKSVVKTSVEVLE